MPKLNDFFYKYNYAFPHYILEENHRNENALLTCIYNGKSDIFYPFRNSKDSLNNISTLSSRAFHVICFSKSQQIFIFICVLKPKEQKGYVFQNRKKTYLFHSSGMMQFELKGFHDHQNIKQKVVKLETQEGVYMNLV